MDALFDNLKRCASCGRELERSLFYRSKFTRDGLQAYCKDCQRDYRRKHPTKEYKYLKKDKETLSIW